MITGIATLSMAIMITMISLVFLIQYTMVSLGYMGCMKKVGEATWKAWIPLYSDYIMYKIVNLKRFLIIFKVVYVIITIIYLSLSLAYVHNITERADEFVNDATNSSYTTRTKSDGVKVVTSVKSTSSYEENDFVDNSVGGLFGLMFMGFFNSLFGIAVFVINILFAINISKTYGLGGGTIAGMILIPQIFILIIGFGNSKYQGSYQPATKQSI